MTNHLHQFSQGDSDESPNFKNISLLQIIEKWYGHTIKPLDPQKHSDLLEKIKKAMVMVCAAVNKHPIIRPRPNEVGNDMELFVIDALNNVGLHAYPPKTRSGNGKSTGYPDIFIDHPGAPIYLEVKTFSQKTHETTQRSFYVSPSEDPKVTCDAHHIVVGFEIQRQGDTFTTSGHFKIVDLFYLVGDIKIEFNSDNRRLYTKGLLLDI